MNTPATPVEHNVLVDTCVWSLLLRRQEMVETPLTLEFKKLVTQQRVIMLGVVRQEVLSGIREKARVEVIREKLRTFPDFPITLEDYETAAEFYNICRAKGVQGSLVDFLLCAISTEALIFWSNALTPGPSPSGCGESCFSVGVEALAGRR